MIPRQSAVVGREGGKRVGLSTWIVGFLAAILVALGMFAGGLLGGAVYSALVMFLTGLYVLITGRPSWARFRGRRMGFAAAAFSFVVLAAAGVILGKMQG